MIDKNSFDFNSLSNALGFQESGKDYSENTGNGAYGKYQFIEATIARVATYLGEPIPSIDTFLGDPTMQDRYYVAYAQMIIDQVNSDSSSSFIGQHIVGSSNGISTIVNEYGLVAGGWLGGEHAPYNFFFLHHDPDDKNGTHVSDYIAEFSDSLSDAKKKSINNTISDTFHTDCVEQFNEINSQLASILNNADKLYDSIRNFRVKHGI